MIHKSRIEELRQAIHVCESSELRLQLLIELGALQADSAQFADALDTFTIIIQTSPTSLVRSQALRRAGYAASQLKKSTLAIEYFEHLDEKEFPLEDQIQDAITLADLYSQVGRIREAFGKYTVAMNRLLKLPLHLRKERVEQIERKASFLIRKYRAELQN